MKRQAPTLAIIFATIVVVYLLNLLSRTPKVVGEYAVFVQHPIFAATAVVVGALFIALESAMGARGLAGVFGTILVALVVVPGFILGNASTAGTFLLLAGAGGIILAAKVYRGNALVAVTGVVMVFLGLVCIFTAIHPSLSYAVGVSSVAGAISFVALIGYIPRDAAWCALYRDMQTGKRSGVQRVLIQTVRTEEPNTNYTPHMMPATSVQEEKTEYIVGKHGEGDTHDS